MKYQFGLLVAKGWSLFTRSMRSFCKQIKKKESPVKIKL